MSELASTVLPTEAIPTTPTPLIPVRRLSAWANMRLHLKDERSGPTMSYKDRLASMVAPRARQGGYDTVVLSSSGNHGAAVAHAATAAGLRAVILTITSIPFAMRRQIEGCGGQLVAVERAEDRWTVVRAAVKELGWFPAANFHDPAVGSNPYLIDGYQSIAWEIVEQLGHVPDWVSVPVGYGDGISGIAKGFSVLQQAGLADRVPRMLAAETSGSISDALATGSDKLQVGEIQARAALSIACPQGTYQALHAVRSTDGTAVTVDDSAVLAARAALARLEGSFHEISSAAALAAVLLAREGGTITSGESVVIIGTSTGLKDQRLPTEETPLAPVEPTISALNAMS